MNDSRTVIAEAFGLAESLHRGQCRKQTTVPYVYHLLSVAALVGEYGGVEAQVVAALLHDAAEDQGGLETLALIEHRFGSDVAAYVRACSDSMEDPKPPWRARKEAFLRGIAEMPVEARLIVAADKLHNTLSLLRDYRQTGEALWLRFSGGREGTLWYYSAAAEALAKHWNHPIVSELHDAVRRLLDLAEAPVDGQ